MLKGLKTDVIIHSRGLNMKTVKQLSKELEISKTYLMKIIDSHNLRSNLQKVGNKFMINSDTEISILKVLNRFIEEETQTESQTNANNSTTETQNNNNSSTTIENKLQTIENSSVIDFLQEQLRMKDKQIEELHRLLNQEQQLNAKNTQKIELLENKQEEYQKTFFGLYRKIK